MPAVSVVSPCLGSPVVLAAAALGSVRGNEATANTQPPETRILFQHQFHRCVMMHGEVVAALCLLLSSPPSTLQSKQGDLHAPPAPPHASALRGGEETKQTHASLDQGNAKVGLFIAASVGTFALMAAVYCIYTRFYTKQQYLHTQLNNDSDFMSDPPAVFFQPSFGSSVAEVQRGGYGSLSDTPSIISVPPSLSPLPPSAMPFPPPFVSSRSMRTISAKDLEKSCI